MGDLVREVQRRGKRHLVIDFRYVDSSGRKQRYRHDASVQNWTAARAEAKRLQEMAIKTGSVGIERPESETLSAFVDGTFAAVFLPTFRKATRVRYEALVEQGIREAFGHKRLDAISTMQLRAYGTELLKRGIQPRGHLNLVKTIFRCAVQSGAMAAAPEVPKLGKPSKKLPDAPTVEEVAAMLHHAKGWIRTAIALAAYAGLRQGEVRALEVRDVDLKEGRLTIRRALSEDDLTTPKSGHERAIPIASELVPILAEAVKGKFPMTRVVVNTRGHTPGRAHVLSALKDMQRRHGLRERSFHSLRHAFCSRLASVGANVEAVRLLAGHSSISVTQRYVHARGDELVDAISRLGGNSGVTAKRDVCK